MEKNFKKGIKSQFGVTGNDIKKRTDVTGSDVILNDAPTVCLENMEIFLLRRRYCDCEKNAKKTASKPVYSALRRRVTALSR